MKRIFRHNVNIYVMLICYELSYMFHECSILMYVLNTLIIYVLICAGEIRVLQFGIRAGRSVRPSCRVVVSINNRVLLISSNRCL